jgi:tetratricopeptide (TPR) repeat protein
VGRIRNDTNNRRWHRFKKRFGGVWDFSRLLSLITEYRRVSRVVLLATVILAAWLVYTYCLPHPTPQELRAALEQGWFSQQMDALKSLKEGEEHYHAKRYQKAYDALSKAIEAGADGAYARTLRAIAAVNLGQPHEAIRDFSVLAAMDPDSSITFARRGLVFEGMGSYRQAVEDYRQALVGTGADAWNMAEIFFYQSRAYTRLGDYEQALAAINQTIQLGKQEAKHYLLRAQVEEMLKHYPQAIDDYSKVVKLEANRPQGYLGRGRMYVKLQKFDQALPDLTKAIELAPHDSQAYFHRGEAHMHLGHYAQARRDLEFAAAHDRVDAKRLLRDLQALEKSSKKIAASQARFADGIQWETPPKKKKSKKKRPYRVGGLR